MHSEARQTAHASLLKSKETLLWKQHVETRLAQAEKALAEQIERMLAHKRVCDRESADVKQLTGLSIVGILASILGTKEQRLKKERQEAAAAALKLDTAREVADGLERERDLLADELAGMKGAEATYRAALDAKRDLLASEGDAGRRLAELAEEEATLMDREREIREALSAGTAAEKHLQEAVNSLNAARDWGTLDLFGGGMITTALKHSRLDEAADAAGRAQFSLIKFNRELADLGRQTEREIEIGEFSRFADYFFDGLIMDWIVQSKISEAQDRVEVVHRKVGTLVQQLRADLIDCKESLARLESRRVELIERS